MKRNRIALDKITATIFDIDGTLTDTTVVDDRCFIRAFRNVFGIDISDENWADFNNVTDRGITEEVIVRRWNRSPTLPELEKMEREFVRLLKDEYTRDKSQFKSIDGAEEFVRILSKKSDIEVGIATGGWEKSAKMKLHAIGIEPGNFALSTSSQFKSREDILASVMMQIRKVAKRPVEQVVYFGDGAWDLQTCKVLGIDFVGIDARGTGYLQKMGAKHIFKNFAQPGIHAHITSFCN